mgnify:CR=1 FL=1
MNTHRILLLAFLGSWVCGVGLAEQSVLSGQTSGSFRWLDAAGNAYGSSYQSSYSYQDATVTVDYEAGSSGLSGTVTASNLKPNFAYQLKLSGDSRAAGTANEELGKTGRWWHEEWNGSAWVNGSNDPNKKGDGTYPNPNDENWLNTRDEVDATSPTGYRYKFTAYRLFDYFFTDADGDAMLHFQMDSSYHVLWKTTQTWPYDSSQDGPIKAATFDPDPAMHDAYDTDYAESSVEIYGEWERLPQGDIPLQTGVYDATFELTEESFHGVDGTGSGYWALAMSGPATFTIPEPGSVLLLLALSPLLLRRRQPDLQIS